MAEDAPSVVAICGKNRIGASGLAYAVHVFAARWPKTRLVAIPGPDDPLVDAWQPSMRQVAMRLQVPIVEMTSLYEIPDLVLISLEYSRIVRVAKFASSRLYNIHFSALPAYRGMYTSIWPILNGETHSGVTFHQMDAGADTGPIVSQRIFPLPSSFTSRQLYDTNLNEGLELFRVTLQSLIEGVPPMTVQDESRMSYYFKSSFDFTKREIDLARPVEEVSRFVRALAFPEYQLPVLRGRRVNNCRILPLRTTKDAGAVLLETPVSTSFATGGGGVIELEWANDER
jgi:methionyl-tRNA formyltransferase